jgi:hypothetical protein
MYSCAGNSRQLIAELIGCKRHTFTAGKGGVERAAKLETLLQQTGLLGIVVLFFSAPVPEKERRTRNRAAETVGGTRPGQAVRGAPA